MIGIEPGKAVLKNYTNDYKIEAKNTIDILNKIIGDKVIKIEHVGSTAIIGIKSKPIIDIAVGIKSFNIVNDIKDILEENEFLYSKEKLNGTVVDFVCNQKENRTHNIHFVIFQEERWKEFVLFKDYLNKYPDIALEYENLKMHLSERYANDIRKYTEGKKEFISNVLKKAEEEL